MKKLNLNSKVFIIAEIGVNHEGDLKKAFRMITLAKRAGADAVKFQTYLSESYVSSSQKERLERVKRFELSFDDFRMLKKKAVKENIIFISTPLDPESLKLVDELSPLIKISSGDINNLSFLTMTASYGKPVILSTGLATTKEIEEAIGSLLKGNKRIIKDKKLILLHCVAAYPAPEEEVNLLSIPFMKKKFNVPVGYSDHTKDILAAEAAVVLGACVIEKHFTYRKERQTFQDHHISASPREFSEMVDEIRRIEKMLGKHAKKPVPSESNFKSYIRRSAAARRDLKPGERVEADDIYFLRPENGIPMKKAGTIPGKKVKRHIKKGELIKKDYLGK